MRSILLLFSCLLLNQTLTAGPGDTIRVQTIDFNTPVNPGWNSPREGKYLFPPDSISFEKILMYYTLKCDPGQSPACGEWDYTTHTQLWYHTGQFDSTLYFHPNFIVNGFTPDTFNYMEDVSFRYQPFFEYSGGAIPLAAQTIGNGSDSFLLAADDSRDGRHQLLFRGTELQAAGLSAGDIVGLRMMVMEGGGYFSHLKIRMGVYDGDTLTTPVLEGSELTEVYSRNTSLNTTGWNSFSFSAPFYWDGVSNIVADISFTGHSSTTGTMLLADLQPMPSALSSMQNDFSLDFEGTDYIAIPAEAVQTIDSAITVCFWQYGDPSLQPQDNTIFAAVDPAGNRILNVHLPWSNSKVYWDAGFDNGNDRIYITLPNPSYYEGQWNHWAFVKDCRTGEMKIFFNGELFCYAWGKYKPLNGIAAFHIGAHPYGQMYYDGMIDEFQVWDIALDEATVTEWLHKSIDGSHPFFSNLKAYYKFDEGEGFVAGDSGAGANTANLYGYPNWLGYDGAGRILNFGPAETRPMVRIEMGDFDPNLTDTLLAVDTISYGPLMAVLYSDSLQPLVPTDTLTAWPSYYDNYVFDPEGNAIDSTYVTPDGQLVRHDWGYYGAPYEILDPYELGRFITPYGNNLSLGNGWTWVYDVTDFRPLLKDSVHLTAGNFQELLDLDFLMIEGTPPREVKKIDKLWNGYWALSTFNTVVPDKKIPLDSNSSQFKVKITTSGHEWDNPTNCAEFCEKTHWLDVDGTTRHTWEIIDECADNPLYPQGGTWIYDRAGWCPGARVTERHLEVTDFVVGDSVLLDYNCEPDVYGAYSVSSFLFSYGAPNFSLDAAVVDVTSPNSGKTYLRFNPMCGRPEIVIRNTGATPLTSLVITYGPQGGIMKTFNWSGSLVFMQSETVTLDPIDWTGWVNGNNQFIVTLSEPNGGQDEYVANNTYLTNFNLSPEYPNEFVVKFKTNKAGYENRWEIADAEGNIVVERDGFANQTTYFDTLLLADGCYTFTMHDEGNDGISFWANSMGSGTLTFLEMDGSVLQGFNGDFGKFTSRSFTVGMAVDVQDIIRQDYFNIYPNPTSGRINIDLALLEEKHVQVIISGADGIIVFSEDHGLTGQLRRSVDLNARPGLYFCQIRCNDQVMTKKIVVVR